MEPVKNVEGSMDNHNHLLKQLLPHKTNNTPASRSGSRASYGRTHKNVASDRSVRPRLQALFDDESDSNAEASFYPILENAVRMVEARRNRNSTTASDLNPERQNVERDADGYLRELTPNGKPSNNRHDDTTKADFQPSNDGRVTLDSESDRSALMKPYFVSLNIAHPMEHRRVPPSSGPLASSVQQFIHQEDQKPFDYLPTANHNSLVPEGEVFANPDDPRVLDYIENWTRESKHGRISSSMRTW